MFRGTRATRAGVPKLGGALRLDTHLFGQNPRKRKLTESPGTNPSKLGGGKGLLGGGGGLSQESAPYKHEASRFNIGVGGPGFDEITPKVPKT